MAPPPAIVCASELGLARLCAGAQVHGATVQRAGPGQGRDNGSATAKADGQATNLAGSGMMVLTADCLPVIVASPRAVAAVHAGWRGLAAGVLEEGVRAVRELGAVTAQSERRARAGTRPGDRRDHRAGGGAVLL